MRQRNLEPHKLFITFSAYTQGRRLFDITENKSPNAINCLNGLRAMSVMWIMFGHRIGNQTAFGVANRDEFVKFFDTLPSVIVSSYTLAVDTFFLMGGLLVTGSVLKAHEMGRLSILRMIYHRYIRYTPAFAACILFTVSVHKYFVDGHATTSLVGACERMWWPSLLHIQNYFDANEMCLEHAWYLSADFQLFVISLFLIYSAIKFGRKYIWSLSLIGLLSSISVLVVSLVFEVHARLRSAESSRINNTWIYFPTHARMAPWMIGMTLGYAMFQLRNKKLQFSRTLNATLWITSLSSLVAVVASIFPLMSIKSSHTTSLIYNAVFLAFHRLIWSLAIAWIIFACHQLKTGGVVKWFLELRQFQPICRMGLSLYLVHPLYQISTMMNLKQSIFMSYGQMVSSRILDLCQSN